MAFSLRLLATIASPLLLISCAPSIIPTTATPAAAPRPMSIAGLGTVLGQNAGTLATQFGTPVLDVREGSARKLQYSGAACVLDAYLYPTGNAPHRVTYVDTRTRALGGIDQALCVRSLAAP